MCACVRACVRARVCVCIKTVHCTSIIVFSPTCGLCICYVVKGKLFAIFRIPPGPESSVRSNKEDDKDNDDDHQEDGDDGDDGNDDNK